MSTHSHSHPLILHLAAVGQQNGSWMLDLELIDPQECVLFTRSIALDARSKVTTKGHVLKVSEGRALIGGICLGQEEKQPQRSGTGFQQRCLTPIGRRGRAGSR